MIHILGAGAIGCLWAACLSREQEVCFVSRRSSDKQRISFTLEQAFLPASDQNKGYSFPLTSLSDQVKAPDLLLICTKSYATLPALRAIQRYITENTSLVLFQNGLGSQYQLLEHFPDNPVFAAVTTEGANKRSNSELIHAGQGCTLLGALNQAAQDAATLEQCYQSLSGSALTVVKSEDIGFALWQKLAINCAINPFTAIANCTNGELLELPLFADIWPGLRQELSQLLKSAGYPLGEVELETVVFDVINSTRHNISSMLQDIRQHKQTEIDDINGFAWRYLKRKQLNHAINRQLWEQVSALGN